MNIVMFNLNTDLCFVIKYGINKKRAVWAEPNLSLL